MESVKKKIAKIYFNGWEVGRIVKVEKPTFPRSGMMDKKGYMAIWNAKTHPYAYSICGDRWFWYETLDALLTNLKRLNNYRIEWIDSETK